MYFSSAAEERPQSMTEITSLQHNPEIECCWSLRRVGSAGLVVLLRGFRSSAINKPIVLVSLLSGEEDPISYIILLCISFSYRTFYIHMLKSCHVNLCILICILLIR